MKLFCVVCGLVILINLFEGQLLEGTPHPIPPAAWYVAAGILALWLRVLV